MEETGLVKFDAAIAAIAKAKSVDELKDIRDKAEACRQYAKKAGAGLKAQNMLAEIKIRAERRAGEFLGDMERHRHVDGRPKKAPHDGVLIPTLKDLGIDDHQAQRWQLEASVPEEVFAQHVEDTEQLEKELTSAGVLRLAKKLQPRPETPDLPAGQFNVLYADPPWQYADKLIQGYGAAEHHYPCMSIEELCALPIREHVADNAVLFLWVTSPLLSECWPVIKAWGFEYKTCFVWDKVKHNYGHYNSVRHELLLVCTRGTFLPQNNQLFDSVQQVERTVKHSQKPERFRQIIEAMYPDGNYLELFARSHAKNWQSYGNEL